MKSVRLRNETRGTVLCAACGVAEGLLSSMRGLLGRRSLSPDEGLIIVRCSSIHTFGMQFAIDVAFITRDNVVTDFIENMAPGRVHVAKAHHGKPYAAIEMPARAIAASGTQSGDVLSIENAPDC